MRRHDLVDVRRCGVDWRGMSERADGDWLSYDDHLAALDDERRQTQRRMIAALYWRGGHAAVMVDEWRSAGNAAGVERAAYEADALTFAARVLEAAL